MAEGNEIDRSGVAGTRPRAGLALAAIGVFVAIAIGVWLATRPADRATVYRGVGWAIDEGRGPELAAALDASLPPHGGGVRLVGFDWGSVSGERTLGKVTWGGPYTVTGTWDGRVFTLTRPAGDGTPADWPPEPASSTPTPGCTFERMAPMVDALGRLDLPALGILLTSSYGYDGHCGVVVTATFDTPALRAALAGVGDDVTVTHQFRPTTG